jgi:hypothetical protein
VADARGRDRLPTQIEGGGVSGHPDDDVTDEIRAYNAAFVRWLRTGADIDLRRRESAFVRMVCESRAQRDEVAA